MSKETTRSHGHDAASNFDEAVAAAESGDHPDEAEQASSEMKEKEMEAESYIFPMVTDVCVVDTCKVLIIIITN